MKPYTDTFIDEKTFIRKFSSNVNRLELKWHVDEHNRVVIVMNNNDWMFQENNKLPIKIPLNTKIYIENNKYHRLIKGNTDLVLKITEI